MTAPMEAAGPRACAVSVDLDPLGCYHRIHALGAPPAQLANRVLERALPRFLDLLGRRGVRATLFLVGEELEGEGGAARAARALVADAARAGHELANHSHTHPYDLTRLPPGRIAWELERAHAAIAAAGGAAPVGFRAPGYGVSGVVLGELARLGYRYDSSVFPAPGYYAAKAAVMAALRLARRPSGAILTDPRALAAPADPYRPELARPWRRGTAPLVELPIAVTPLARVPVIGTNLLVAPAWLRELWLARMRGRSLFNLELHGIDLLDAEEDDVPGELARREPALRRPLAARRRALEAALDRIGEASAFLTLAEAAADYVGRPG